MPMAAMTNKELIKRLLDWSESDEGKINDTREVAADRIEALHNEWRFNADGWSDALVRIEALVKYRDAYAEMERIATEALIKSEARVERLEAAMIQMRDDKTGFRHAVHFRRFITATLKGDDHE